MPEAQMIQVIEENQIEEHKKNNSEIALEFDYNSYNFDDFISKMRHESCKPVLENIKRFIKVFLDKLPSTNIEEMVEAYKSFYSVIKVKCMQAEIWRNEETTPSERANALEGLESLIMNQLHDRVLSFDSSERDVDNFMERKMVLHAGWIQLEHLDVPDEIAQKLKESEGNWISTAVTEFQKMSVYRTPRDKLVCALNGCKIINSLINDTEMSADDFLPVLIYTLIRANPPQIYSNINYISRFRAPEKISGENAYSFTHLMAAVEFIEKMDRQALKITEESYETFMEASISEINQNTTEDNDEEAESKSQSSFNLDMAEAKAEEFILKAKEVFKVTGERANQAFSSIKESTLAKKSMEKLTNFMKDLNRNGEGEGIRESVTEKQRRETEDFDTQLARAVSLSLMDDKIIEESVHADNEKSEKDLVSEKDVDAVSEDASRIDEKDHPPLIAADHK